MIIGISGYARAGKDEIAKILVEEFDFKRIAFADKLREVLYQLNPIVRGRVDNQGYWDIIGGGEQVSSQLMPFINHYSYVQDVIDQYGWDGYKETEYGPEIRRLLQRLGTEAGRNTLWDSIWVDAALKDYKPGDRLVVPDMRFPNEFDAIKAHGGKTWRVNREGVVPANSHASEIALDNHKFDVVINNSGSLDRLHNIVVGLFSNLQWGL